MTHFPLLCGAVAAVLHPLPSQAGTGADGWRLDCRGGLEAPVCRALAETLALRVGTVYLAGDAPEGTERRGPNRWFGRGQGVDDGDEVAAVTGEDHGLAVGVRDARRRTGRVVGGWVGDRIGHGAVSVAVGSDGPRGVTGVAGVSGRLPFSQPPGRMSPLGRVHP